MFKRVEGYNHGIFLSSLWANCGGDGGVGWGWWVNITRGMETGMSHCVI